MVSELFSLFLLVLFVGGTHGLRVMDLEIPQVVVLGEETTLTCLFDLEEDTLYSIKWYRDDLEFFRYVPSDKPPNQFFPLQGIEIDLGRSSNGTVYINDVDVSTAGTYKCEISADEPSFQTVSAEKMLTVTIANSASIRKTSGSTSRPASSGQIVILLLFIIFSMRTNTTLSGVVNDSARIPDPGVLAASFTLLLLCHFTVW